MVFGGCVSKEVLGASNAAKATSMMRGTGSLEKMSKCSSIAMISGDARKYRPLALGVVLISIASIMAGAGTFTKSQSHIDYTVSAGETFSSIDAVSCSRREGSSL